MGKLEKIIQDVHPGLGQDGFRVELYSPDWQITMFYPHNFLVVKGGGRDFKAGGQGVWFNDQGVVAGSFKRVGDSLEKVLIVMGYL